MALSYLNGIGQNALVRSTHAKLESKIEMLFPSEAGTLYESYVYFKSVYWLKERDTVFQNADLIYSNKRLTIDQEGFESMEACDSTINKIRNTSLSHRMRNQLNDSIAFYIGSDNKEMAAQKSPVTTNDIIQKCYADFETEYVAWFDEQLVTIQAIRTSKKQRLKQIEAAESLDEQFVISFLNDFGSCDVDFNALEMIILKDADLLLTILNKWPDIEFNKFKWKLDNFKFHESKDEVIQKLENILENSKRQKTLLKHFKKTTA